MYRRSGQQLRRIPGHRIRGRPRPDPGIRETGSDTVTPFLAMLRDHGATTSSPNASTTTT